MIVRQPAPEETLRTWELFSIAFECSINREAKARENDPRLHRWAAYTDDNRMMSFLISTEFQINFDGNSCKMGGIGGVSTLPQYRKKGGIRGCFAMALPQMYREGYDFSYLYPFSSRFYRQFGYENCVRLYEVTVNLALLKQEPVSGESFLTETDCPMMDQIRQVDQAWEKRFNMMVLHNPDYWRWNAAPDPALTKEYTYVYCSSENRPLAYTTFRGDRRPDGKHLVCSRFCFSSPEGFRGLMNLFRSMAADYKTVRFQLPAQPAMMYLLPEWSLNAITWEVKCQGMVRVINAASVLKKAAYRGTGSLVLALTDAEIPENNAVFRVDFRDGKAEKVAPTQQEPQIRLNISAFSALIAGVWDFEEIRDCLEGVEVTDPSACFSQVFYRKPMMITDGF